MNKPTFLLLPFASLFFASCGGDKGENYDTAPTPSYEGGVATPTAPAPNPTYDTAAYEENTPVPATPVESGVAVPTPGLPAEAATVPAVGATAGAREHYVAPGDSLWKISNTYKVPIESIKAANNMTTDTVVLGKKLIIPAQ